MEKAILKFPSTEVIWAFQEKANVHAFEVYLRRCLLVSTLSTEQIALAVSVFNATIN